jgi:2-hydroxychromene-2-carboxylate isomerase
MHAVASLGLDMTAVKRDAGSESVTAEITAARTLAEILAIHGTPYFVVGETIIEGAPAKLLEMLKTQVADAKRTGR